MNNMLRSIATAVTLVLGSTLLPAVDKAAVDSHYARYFAAGKSVVDMALSRKVDPAEVARQVDIMLESAVWMSAEYGRKHPEGAGLLGTVAAQVGAMKKLSFEELEGEWHDLGYFKKNDPGLDLSDEDNEHFTDPIHTIVHPLMVLKAAQKYSTSQDAADLQAMKEEMEEGLEQAGKTCARIVR